MPVTDRPHDLGLNPQLHRHACRQASTLVPFQDHRYDAGISHQPEHPAQSKAGVGQSHTTPCKSVHGSVPGGDSRASQSHPSGSHLTSAGNTCPSSSAQ